MSKKSSTIKKRSDSATQAAIKKEAQKLEFLIGKRDFFSVGANLV